MLQRVLSRTLSVSPRRWLLLPVETKAREFDGKALLSFVAAERGWGAILGKNVRRKDYVRPGLFLENSISPGRLPDIKESLKFGHKVCAWCEEGLVYLYPEEYGRRRVEHDSYDLLSHYFAWGKNQAHDMANDLGCDREKIVVTGNPRFDLLRPDLRAIFSERVKEIRAKYGSFILMNTRFARYNSLIGSDAIISRMRKRGKLRTEEHEAEAKGYVEFQRATFHEFVQAAKTLSQQHKEHKIVIRPHPSESHVPWLELAANTENIEVVYDGNVAEWILASDICIHNNCTTGVEAYMLGAMPVSYRPVRDKRFDTYLPSALSMEAFTLNDLCDLVSRSLKDSKLTPSPDVLKMKETARRFIGNIEGPLACDRIMDVLDGLEIAQEPVFKEDARLDDVVSATRKRLRPIKDAFRDTEALRKRQYGHQKFPGVNLTEAQALLRSAQSATSRFGNVKIRQLEDNVFCVYC